MTNVVKLAKTRKTNNSAVSQIQMSGLKLIRERKMRGRKATMRDFAKLDWEPWEKTDRPGPGVETMNYLGFYCRVSAAIMTRTKVELSEIHTNLEHKEVDKLVAGLIDTAEMLKALASVAESAYLRVLASASSHHLSGGKFRGVHDMRKKKRTLLRA